MDERTLMQLQGGRGRRLRRAPKTGVRRRAVSVASSIISGYRTLTPAADHQRIAKLDRDDAPKPPEKIDMSVGKALAQARADKKNPDGKSMTQKELATAVNARPSDVSRNHRQRQRHQPPQPQPQT